MPSKESIDDLMLRWEDARRQGKDQTLDILCASSPHLSQELGERIHAIEVMEAVLGVHEDDPERTLTTSCGEGPAPKHRGPLPHIPGYELIRVVDQGGMGVVYEARQLKLGRTVAIKMLLHLRLGPRHLARFRTEAEAAARLQHPNFVQVFEVGQIHGQPFYSMEYVAGGSLARHLAEGPPSPRRAAELVAILAEAVHTAHEHGIVHRDLKPSNVILTAAGAPKIADFGLAKRLDDEADHTVTGEILGTPSYMAPEQAEGKRDQIGPATDVYALGVMLYEMLTGQPPFRGDSALELLRQVVNQDPIAPRRLLPSVPRDLEAICLKCLEKTPRRRYGSARELGEDLRRFLNGQPVAARRTGALQRVWKWVRRHPQAAALTVVLVVLAFIPLFYAIDYYRTQEQLRLRAEEQAPLVREILERNCASCHGRDPAKVKKNLNVLNHASLLDSARNIIVPGMPGDSRLIQRITDGSMPPEEDEIHLPRVSEKELAILNDWILGGAPPFPPHNPQQPTPAVVPYSPLAAKVKAIFQERCHECHNFKDGRGGIKILHHRLLLTVRKVVVPHRPDKSELFRLLTTPDEDERMPPPPEEALTPQEIATIRQWIAEGALPFPSNK